MPREIDHAELLNTALREHAEQRLSWLRDPARPPQLGSAAQWLFSPEGWECLQQAIRDRRYSAAELDRLPDALAELARERARRTGRAWLSTFLQQRLAVGSTQRVPARVLAPWIEPVQSSHSARGPSEALRALGRALEPHVVRLIELREQALHEEQTWRDKVAKLLPQPNPPEPTGEPAPAVETTAELAARWLERTDDAWRELARWLIRHSELPSTENELARVLVGLRAFALDGLASPDRRFYRLALGARKLGFERDMTSRMRGENAPALLVPAPVCLALSTPSDVRVMQPDLEYGVLSDVSVAQGLGEGLALALVSPAVPTLLRRPLGDGASVSAALGGLFAQLRADSAYLRRVDGFEREAAERAARCGALWTLMRTRLTAALTLAGAAPARSTSERVERLSTAGEQALGRSVPAGLMALSLLAEDSVERQFLALHWGFGLHGLLRERFDQDFYLNPRLSEVVRGAAARGAAIDAPALAAELGARGTPALDRLFELLR